MQESGSMQGVAADCAAKRRFFVIEFLNSRLDGAMHDATIGKPFDDLAEGLVAKQNRGDWTPLELFVAGVGVWEAGLRQCLNDGTTSAQ